MSATASGLKKCPKCSYVYEQHMPIPFECIQTGCGQDLDTAGLEVTLDYAKVVGFQSSFQFLPSLLEAKQFKEISTNPKVFLDKKKTFPDIDQHEYLALLEQSSRHAARNSSPEEMVALSRDTALNLFEVLIKYMTASQRVEFLENCVRTGERAKKILEAYKAHEGRYPLDVPEQQAKSMATSG